MRKRDHRRTHANTCGCTRTKPTREQKCQLQTGNKPCRKDSRLIDSIHVTYLKPSTLGMKRLGFGGSLWQRGTLTGRGLFLGAKKKQNASLSSFLMKPHQFWKIIPIRVTLVVINSDITTTQNQTLTPKMNYHTESDVHLVNIWLHIQTAFLLLATRCHYCPVYGGDKTTKVAKRGEMSSPERRQQGSSYQCTDR